MKRFYLKNDLNANVTSLQTLIVKLKPNS